MATQKYESIISKSDQRSDGPPAVYQLRPKKQKFGTRMTVGEKNPNKTNRTILLLGETGAGKSTLINALLNYTMGVKWEDRVWFTIAEEERRSQTSDVMVYEIFGFEDETLPYSLTIIDTPGYGDTRGTEHDDIISHRLLDLFQSDDGVHEVHAVGLVMKASENRLGDRLLYVFDSVMSLFGKNLEKNIVALITHSDGSRPKNPLQALEDWNIKCAKKGKNQPVYFLFDNCQLEDEEEEFLKLNFERSERGVREFTAFLKESTPVQPEATPEVLKERIRLTACIQNLQERIRFTEVKQREMKQTREALQKNEVVTPCVVFKHKEPIRAETCGPGLKAAVSCTVCEENCHYPGCTVPLNHCEVFRDGLCTSCTNKCPASVHVKEKRRYVTRIRRGQKNEPPAEDKDVYLFGKEMKLLAAEKSQFLDESYQHAVRLEEIALKADSASTVVHLDFLIEKMKQKGDTEKVQKLEEMRRREDEEALWISEPMKTSHEDIISNSFLISSGPPAVCQLRPQKQKFGSLTRMTVGEKNPNKTNRTILLVGETGAGKSTLINALVNYTMGVKWEDEVWFTMVEEEEKKSQSEGQTESQSEGQTESQTSDVMVYELFGFEGETLPYSLTIIDTPGYRDTRGIEHDDIISHRLLDLFGSDDGVHEVHAVGLVMKASENRLGDRLKYVFDSVMSLFGKNMEKNIVALITHSNGSRPENPLQALEVGNIKCAKKGKKQPVYFLFDNCQHEERMEENTISKNTWELTQKNMDQFTDFLEKSSPQKLMTTVEVLNERIRLKASIQNLKERIEFIDLKQTEIRQIQEALRIQEIINKHEVEMKKIKEFTVEVDEPYKDKQPIDGGQRLLFFYRGAVCCTVCEENCHYPGCTMAWKPAHCKVMKGGRCTVCTNKCPASDHVKEKWRYVTKTRRVMKTNEEMKKQYEKNELECALGRSRLQTLTKEVNDLTAADSSLNKEEMQQKNEDHQKESEKKCTLLENLEKEIIQLTAEKSQFLDESYQHVVRLEQIALKADSASTTVHLDFLIEKMKQKGDRKKVKKLEKLKRISLTSSPHEDIISKSFLISSGPPAVYQLRPQKQKFGSLTRITVGEKNPDETNRTILLVGETGAGKSTLINALLNYTMGVKWEDEVWFMIAEEERRSQTSDVMVYEIFGFEDETLPYSLTIIDTPGYRDTRGIEHDDIISHRLLDLFGSDDGVHEVHAVGLVMKASENRLGDRLKYVFDSVMSLFGKNMEKNIVALITHSDASRPKNPLQALEDWNIKCAKKGKNQPVYFLFDNCQHEERMEENTISKNTWELTQKNMDQFTDFLEKSSPQKLMTTVEVLNERIRLKASIQNLKERIKLAEVKQRETRNMKEALKQAGNKMDIKKILSLSENLENEMKQLTAEKSRFLDESYQHAVRLEQIALKADSASTMVHLDFLIEKMKQKGDTEKVQKLEEMRR
ncbi:uncharacterized protein LOC101481830 [Maylandia zebra]|uniref:uncharacterized protein LOC101481830 n=1 Tax=Maylandia zebra TaxID=106582 RepID=UPI0006CF009A